MTDIFHRISSKLRIMPLVGMLFFVSNCTTLPISQESKTIDLSDSYAVKLAEKLSTNHSEDIVRDPRAYYHYMIALNEIRKHQFEKATESFRRIIQFDPSDPKFHHQLALNLIRAGEIDQAYNALDKSLNR